MGYNEQHLKYVITSSTEDIENEDENVSPLNNAISKQEVKAAGVDGIRQKY